MCVGGGRAVLRHASGAGGGRGVPQLHWTHKETAASGGGRGQGAILVHKHIPTPGFYISKLNMAIHCKLALALPAHNGGRVVWHCGMAAPSGPLAAGPTAPLSHPRKERKRTTRQPPERPVTPRGKGGPVGLLAPLYPQADPPPPPDRTRRLGFWHKDCVCQATSVPATEKSPFAGTESRSLFSPPPRFVARPAWPAGGSSLCCRGELSPLLMGPCFLCGEIPAQLLAGQAGQSRGAGRP